MNAIPDKNANLDLIGTISALGLCIMFGSNAIAVKYTLTGVGICFVAGLRFLVASICLLVWATVTGQSLRVPKNKLLPLLTISAAFSLQLLLFYFGLSKTTAARSSLITNLQPFFVLFLAHFFIPGDRINLKKVLGIGLAFAGMVFVFMDHSAVSKELRTGDFVVLVGAFIWGCNAVYTKKVIVNYEPIQVALYPMFFVIPVSFIASVFLDSKIISFINAGIIGSFIYQCFVAAFGYVVWNTLLKKYGAVTLHSFIFVMPITGVFLGGFILDEPITHRLLAGLVLVVSGLLVIHWKRKKPIRPIFNISRNV